MKTAQKLELYSSISILVAASLQLLLYVFYVPSEGKNSVSIILSYAFCLFFPSILIFVGTYIQVIEEKTIGFVIVLFFGMVFVCFFGFFVMLGFLVGQRITSGETIIALFPSFFVICTMIFASINVVKSDKD